MVQKSFDIRYHFGAPGIGGAIEYITSGPFSHVSWVIGGMEYEAIFKGFVEHEPQPFDGVSVRVPLSPEEYKTIITSSKKMVGTKYDYPGIFGYRIPFIKQSKRKLYCSEALVMVLRDAKICEYDERFFPKPSPNHTFYLGIGLKSR